MNIPQGRPAPGPGPAPAPGPAPVRPGAPAPGQPGPGNIPTDPATGNVVGTDLKPENPVVNAMQTLIMYTAAQTEKGAPNAPQLQAALSGLVTAFQTQGGPQQPPPPGAQPPQPPKGPAPKQEGPQNPQQAAQQPRGQAPNKPIPII